MSSRRKGFNSYKICEDGKCEFYIVNKKGMNFTVLIDRFDLDRLIEFDRPWNAAWREDSKDYYPMCSEYISGRKHNKTHYLYRWIFGSPKGAVIDHIDHDPMNNRRANLRLTDQAGNLKNRGGKNSNNKSGYRNVQWDKRRNKWSVILWLNKKATRLGSFEDVDEAGRFAEEMRKKYYGKFSGND